MSIKTRWVLALIMFASSKGNASTIEGWKIITWQFDGKPDDAAKGQYRWDLKAVAQDTPKHNNPGESPEANNADWVIKNSLANTTKSTGQVGTVGSEPSAKANMDFEATAPEQQGTSGVYRITGIMHSTPQADLVLPDTDPPTHPGQGASAKSQGKMTIAGGTITGATIKQKGGAITNKPQGAFAGGSASFNNVGKLTDPVSVQFLDLTNDALITEDLLSLDIDAAGAAS